ncbi:MAG: SDR family NAD(P)-dependent oxidoreductase [Terricaulis sp.]
MNEFFLNRAERRFERENIAQFFANKRVVITGAAGSIGSALAAELAELGCAHLALLDQFDHGLIDIYERVRRIAPSMPVTEVLCDVRDMGRLSVWMRRLEPDVVLHSAALKHVHLGERHPIECVITNLVGVRNAMAAAAGAGAGHFVLVSSDKAASPVCVMGATKRLAELHLAGFRMERAGAMRLKAVRFGNVLGTQGSVLPRFAAQIAAGGPLEVTHPGMERYFMSAREAVGLILSVASTSEVEPGVGAYVMEMGDPISIVEIGREMIRQSGKDIEIAFTGLRPGERLKEHLYDGFEKLSECSLPGVVRVTPHSADAYVTSADVAHLETIARTMDNSIVRQRVFAYLDERLGRSDRATG